MPFHPASFDEYFAPLAEVLETMASTEGLTLERYYHETPTWSLCFAHPNGGQAKIDISATSHNEVTVQAIWWLDEYETFTRSLLWGEKLISERTAEAVSKICQSTFRAAIAWKKGNWTQVADGYEPYWSSIGASNFEAWANPWPLPVQRG